MFNSVTWLATEAMDKREEKKQQEQIEEIQSMEKCKSESGAELFVPLDFVQSVSESVSLLVS